MTKALFTTVAVEILGRTRRSRTASSASVRPKTFLP
jgi:hypothetical protein